MHSDNIRLPTIFGIVKNTRQHFIHKCKIAILLIGCGMDFISLANTCAPMVEPTTMARIVKVESGFNPYAIGISGDRRLAKQPTSKAEAMITAKWLLDHGYKIAMGYGQISHKEMPGLGFTLNDVFDDCKNLQGSGIILARKFSAAKRIYRNDQDALRAALSSYNTGSFTAGFGNGYVQKIVYVKIN